MPKKNIKFNINKVSQKFAKVKKHNLLEKKVRVQQSNQGEAT